jgi:hypothetical protein
VPDLLHGVVCRIEWAKKHITDLDQRIRAFSESKPYTIRAKPHPVAEIERTALFVESVNPVPDDIALIVGDAVHNLRSSLDHLASQLVEAGGGKPTNATCYPISETPEKYASALKRGVIEGMSVRAQKLIGASQRYVMKDDTLWLLHKLDVIDKHRISLSVSGSPAEWGVDVSDGVSVWFEPAICEPLVPGYEIANIPTTTYSRQQHKDFKLRIDVAFAKPEFVKGKPVLETLNKMADFVYVLVGRFKRFLV